MVWLCVCPRFPAAPRVQDNLNSEDAKGRCVPGAAGQRVRGRSLASHTGDSYARSAEHPMLTRFN
jgi:hypothetical protein